MSAHTTVVGYDASPSSVAALEWAAVDAWTRGSDLMLLHVQAPVPSQSPQTVRSDGGRPEAVLNDGIRRAHAVARSLVVTAGSRVGDAGCCLTEASGRADLLVVGVHAHRPGTSSILESAASCAVANARIPVVVVDSLSRRPAASSLPMVVGYDGTAGADRALDFAAERAARQKAALIVVIAFHPMLGVSREPGYQTAGPSPTKTMAVPGYATTAEHTALMTGNRAVRRAHEIFPRLRIRVVATEGPAVQVLAQASEHCGLIVVGSRGQESFRAFRKSSVSQGLTGATHSPLAVVH